MDKSNKKKIIISVTSIIALVIVVASATYAWWVWQSNSANDVTINLTGSSVVTFHGGTDVSGTLTPVKNMFNSYVMKEISVVSTTEGNSYTLYLQLTTLPTALKSESFLWELKSGSLTYGSGNFSSYSQGDTITIYEGQALLVQRDLYLYFWIDGKNFDNPAAMAGQSFYFNLYATGSDSSLVDVDN